MGRNQQTQHRRLMRLPPIMYSVRLTGVVDTVRFGWCYYCNEMLSWAPGMTVHIKAPYEHRCGTYNAVDWNMGNAVYQTARTLEERKEDIQEIARTYFELVRARWNEVETLLCLLKSGGDPIWPVHAPHLIEALVMADD